MEYEEIWQKLKDMSQRDRKQLAYEVSRSLKSSNEEGEVIGYVHPHYYFDAKAIHEILFYPPHSQKEMEDKNGNYYKALKHIVENDSEIHLRLKCYKWMPRFINDWREGRIVKSYICSRINGDVINKWYRILPGKTFAGERSRSLFLWDGDSGEITYKMTACNFKDGYEQMVFERM